MELKGASSPGILVLTTGLSKPFMRLDKYPALLKELERHMEVRLPRWPRQEEQSGASPGEGITTGLYLRRVSQGLVGCEVVSAYPSSVERRLLQPLLAGRFPVARKRPWC